MCVHVGYTYTFGTVKWYADNYKGEYENYYRFTHSAWNDPALAFAIVDGVEGRINLDTQEFEPHKIGAAEAGTWDPVVISDSRVEVAKEKESA